MIKKEAVLALPPPFRVSDPKINPNAKHMIWAAILLEDSELFAITTSIFITELSSQHRQYTKQDHQQHIDNIISELPEVPQNSSIQKQVAEMSSKCQE